MHKETIIIANLPIRLGQFLKLSNAVQDGLEAKIVITSGEVLVNNQIEMRRGRQLHDGDTVQIASKNLYVLQNKK